MKRIVLLCLAMSACAPAHLEFPHPPADKLVCLDEPGRPAGSGEAYTDDNGVERHRVTDAEAGHYMLDLRASGQTCRDDVDWLRDWFANLK